MFSFKYPTKDLRQDAVRDVPRTPSSIGHRDLSRIKKSCPCFDVKQWLQDIKFHI